MSDIQNVTTIANGGIASYAQTGNDSWMVDEQRASVEVVKAASGKEVTIEFESGGYFPKSTKLLLNGHDISNITHRVVIDSGVRTGTKITIECYGFKGARLSVAGQLTVEEVADEPVTEEPV